MNAKRPSLYTSFSPALLHLYDISNAIVVIIDVLRATSTIATALHNGAKAVIPVDSIAHCIELGKKIEAITAGERDGKIAEGLQYGNSPFEYPPEFIQGRTLVLTTTNGTRLLHMALERGAGEIITGSFPNLSAVCDYITRSGRNVLLACAAWKDRVNIEDMLFAGAVIERVQAQFDMHCDSSKIAASMYGLARNDLPGFMRQQEATHYLRLSGYGLQEDIAYCFSADVANVLPYYQDGKLEKG